MPDETAVRGGGESIHDDREEKKLNPAQIPQARPSLAAGTHPHHHPPILPRFSMGSLCREFHSAPCQGGGITGVGQIRLFTPGPR